MAWTHSASAQAASGGPSVPTVTKPSTSAGQFAWAVVTGTAIANAWPDGWHVDGRLVDQNGVPMSWGHKLLTASEPTTYAFGPSSTNWTVFLETFGNVSFTPADTLETFLSTLIAATATTLAMPRPLTTIDGDLLIYFTTTPGGPTITWSAGATGLQTLNGCGTAWESQAAHGQIPARTATYSVTQPNRTGLAIAYAGIAPAAPVVHTLTGSGVQALSSPVALGIALSGIPASLATGLGNPTRYFGLGSVAWGNANGYARNYFLEHASELVLAPFSSATLLGYSFAPGITATVTELLTN